MGTLREITLREGRDPVFVLLLAAIAVAFVRTIDQPGLDLSSGSVSVKVTPGDLVMAALAVVLVLRLVRTRSYPHVAAAITIAATLFAALILASAVANGGTAFVAAAKLVELTVLLLGCVLLIDSSDRLWVVAILFVAITAIADVWGLVGFVQHPGDRQAAFVGEHDLAAISTLVLVVGLAALYSRHRLGRLPLAAGIVGSVGIILGAALASLLGLFLAALALIAIAAFRGTLQLRPVVFTAALVLALTGATYEMRSGDLGFLQQWLAPAADAQPGQYAGSWSQRLIYAYIGGRVFLDRPVLGTGWWGELPPHAYARFIPDARTRFPDQPPPYFPKADKPFIPQQTFDQVAYELGIVGLALLLSVIVIAARDSLRSTFRWPRGERDELAAYLAAPWLASLLGAIAGSALFGGTPMAALFWLTFGLIGAIAVVATAAARSADPEPA
jgi:hypothetical protein